MHGARREQPRASHRPRKPRWYLRRILAGLQKLLDLATVSGAVISDGSPESTALFSLNKMASHRGILVVLEAHSCERRVAPFLLSRATTGVTSVHQNAKRLVEKLQAHRASELMKLSTMSKSTAASGEF